VDHLLTGSETGSPPQVNGIASIAVLLVLGAVFALALLAPRRPRLPQLLFLAVAGFLLTNKVWSPQYSLWLVPLAVLARPSWRALLAWQVTECLVWVPRLLWFLGTAEKGIGYDWFLRAVLLRDLALGVLAALVVRDVLRPEGDLVRAADGTTGASADDPAGGVLDDAEDRGPLVLAGSREPWADSDGSDGSDPSWDDGRSWPSDGSGTSEDDRRNTT
jgi:uncharacterized membrane protein